jgi:hypothetical protein
MNAFSMMGPNAATWKPVEGKHASIFGTEDSIGVDDATSSNSTSSSMMLNADLAAATNSLRNVTITKATLLQSYNTFGVPLGVSINCLPRNEVVDTGDKYTFTTIPNTSVNTPFALYEAGECHKQAMEWRVNYGKFTASNLTTQDVLEVPNCSYVFVHENHPVVNLLRINKHIVGVDIDDQPRMDGQWLKITRNLFDSSCDTIRHKILARIHTRDLTNVSVHFFFRLFCFFFNCPLALFFTLAFLSLGLQVQLHRIGGVDWSHVSTADALMSFKPDPTWDHSTLEANIKVHTSTSICLSCPQPKKKPLTLSQKKNRPTSRRSQRSLQPSWPGSS